MTNADLIAKLEAALQLLREVEGGMDDRADLDDIQSKLANDVLPMVGMMVDLIHYERPDPTMFGPR